MLFIGDDEEDTAVDRIMLMVARDAWRRLRRKEVQYCWFLCDLNCKLVFVCAINESEF